ncbi:MAG: hypothetical protein Q7U20_02930 [Caulobacter sp.]|nr:hypothetical protein [Caulobacter sp.]
MTRHLDLAGQSGTLYRYKTLEEMRPVPPGGANFVYVKWVGDDPKIVYAGETDSLHRSVFETWDEAQKGYGATEIFARLNITGVVRRAEHDDIVAQHEPPMNTGGESLAGRRKTSRTQA